MKSASLLVALAILPPAGIRARTLVVNGRVRAADDLGPATEARPLRTIARTAAVAQPGDTVLVHAGVYRERVTPARGGEPGKPISYVAAPGEIVVVKGSDIWKPRWQPVAGHPGTLVGPFAPSMFGDYNPYRIRLFRGGPARPEPGPRFSRTLGQVFVDDEPYSEQETLEDVERSPATWMTTPAGDGIYVHFTPSRIPLEKRLVEISVRERIFAPEKLGLGYINIRGFVLPSVRQCRIRRFLHSRDGPQDVGPRSPAVDRRSVQYPCRVEHVRRQL